MGKCFSAINGNKSTEFEKDRVKRPEKQGKEEVHIFNILMINRTFNL
jgi:hypothetical protein